jgi:hypothetical protein
VDRGNDERVYDQFHPTVKDVKQMLKEKVEKEFLEKTLRQISRF